MPVVAWASVIWVFSTDSFSGSGTSRFLGPLLEILLPWADENQLLLAHALVRKLAHVTEYAILAILTFRALSDDRRTVGRVALWTVSLCVLYAGTDEFHQTFVASRTAAATDVLLDSAGAALGAALAVWVSGLISSGRRSRA